MFYHWQAEVHTKRISNIIAYAACYAHGYIVNMVYLCVVSYNSYSHLYSPVFKDAYVGIFSQTIERSPIKLLFLPKLILH